MEEFLNIRLWKNESASLLEQWALPTALPPWSLSLEPIEEMVGRDGLGTFSVTAHTEICGISAFPSWLELSFWKSCHKHACA